MDKNDFDRHVEEALMGIPDVFKNRLENVEIGIEARPSKKLLREMGVRKGGLLLGLFRGVQECETGFFELPHFPPRIILFQESIEAVSNGKEEVIREIRSTLLHEVGHYFGLSERELKKIEKEWNYNYRKIREKRGGAGNST